MLLYLNQIRDRFPALPGESVFLDNPGGTQIAETALDRMQEYLTQHNSNRGGAFATSQASDRILDESRAAVAEFLNASRPEEIVFGPNMTTLTLGLSRALGQILEPRSELVVTRLDHDANIAPWLHIAEARDAEVHWVDFDVETGTLDLVSLERALDGGPRLVAVGYASNALGTRNPLEKIVRLAHAAGALVFVDAVHYAPHGPIDVQQLGCDFLVCSAYKFFGPYVGILYGRYELLEQLPAFKVRPAPNSPPGKFETGTQNHAGIAGVLGALEYLEWVGASFGQVYAEKYAGKYAGRALRLKQAMAAIRAYEYELSRVLLEVLQRVPGLQIYGPADPRQLEGRVPTVSFNLKGWAPRRLAEALDQAGINAWDGNYYAQAVTERLGLEKSGGMVRVGAVHYNTVAEIHRLGEALARLA